VLWQYVLQSIVGVLGAVRRVTAVTRRTAKHILCFNKECICWQKSLQNEMSLTFVKVPYQINTRLLAL
jgi:hypothetical protein